MRCKYKCKVRGSLKVAVEFPLPAGRVTYELKRDSFGVVTHVAAIVSVPDSSMWPCISANPERGISLHINLTHPYFDLVKRDLRAAESLLALFGVEAIDIGSAEQEWLPDSEAEKKQLELFSFKRETTKTSPEQWPEVPFDLVARSFLAAGGSGDIEVALSFFRKGCIDVRESRYIEAIYDFYFMLESVFAQGKFKAAKVEGAFLNNQQLLDHISASLSEPVLLANISGDERIGRSFAETYQSKSAPEIVAHIVKLRGFLHHHSKERKDIWHPEEHVRFGADALFLQQLCFAVGFEMAEPFLFSTKVVHAYMQLAESSAGTRSKQ